MDEISPDNGSTVEKLGRDPWLHTNWQDLFERVAGSSEPPLQRDTLILAVSNKYGCSREFAETVIDKAADCGQLLHVRVHLDDLTWHYYIAEADVVNEACNWVSILLGDVLVNTDALAPEVVSRDELVEQLYTRDNQLTLSQAQHIGDYIEFFAPFYTDGYDFKLEPQVSKYLLTSRSHSQLREAASRFTPADEGPAFGRVLETLADHEQAKKQLQEH